MFKYLGLMLVALSWVVAIMLLLKWRNKDLVTISHHGASTKKAYLLFVVILIGLGAPFCVWVMNFLVPMMHHQAIFVAVLAATFICQFITALAPDIQGWKSNLHRLAAYAMAALYVPLTLLILLTANLPIVAHLVAVVGLCFMLFTIIWVSLLGRSKRYFMHFQMVYVMLMQLTFLLPVYIK